ncbi:MAG TPA: flavodoxin domain-containing protein [Spirochaetia bacterium]|nr:flavodoxin domain-containing protein [Spirochaetia bacterium]
MKALVIYDTKHGSSAEAASAVARGIGPGAEARRLSEAAGSLEPYDLVVVGGPVYFGKWSESAGEWLAARAPELEGKRLAVFALGSMPELSAERIRATLPPALRARLAAVVDLGGRIPEKGLSFVERTLTRLIAKANAKSGAATRELDLAEAEAFGASLAAGK